MPVERIVRRRTKVALVSVEPGGKAMHIARRVRTASTSGHGGEAHKHGGLLPFSAQEGGCSDVGPVSVGSERSVGAGSSSMDCAFWDLPPRQHRSISLAWMV